MTKPELDDFAAEPSDGAIILRRAVIGIGGGILLLFMAGMIAGYASGMIEQGTADLRDAGILGTILLVAGGVAYAMWRLWPGASDEPVAPRVRNARRFMIASLVVGMPLGFVLGAGEDGRAEFVSNTPVSPLVAASVIALWLIVAPLLTWLWWRQIDEHEASAYRDGGLVAVHAYLFVAPAWWMGTRAGWLPQQEPMAVVIAVSLVWGLVWFFRRYF